MDYRQESCQTVVQGLEAIGIQYFIHVPDSFGAPVIAHFDSQPDVRSFPVAKEEEGIGIAAGLAMTGKKVRSVLPGHRVGKLHWRNHHVCRRLPRSHTAAGGCAGVDSANSMPPTTFSVKPPSTWSIPCTSRRSFWTTGSLWTNGRRPSRKPTITAK